MFCTPFRYPAGGLLDEPDLLKGAVYARGKNVLLPGGTVVQITTEGALKEWAPKSHELALRVCGEQEGWEFTYFAAAEGMKAGKGWVLKHDSGKLVSWDDDGSRLGVAHATPGWHEIRIKVLVTDQRNYQRETTLLLDGKAIGQCTMNGPGLFLELRGAKGRVVFADATIHEPGKEKPKKPKLR